MRSRPRRPSGKQIVMMRSCSKHACSVSSPSAVAALPPSDLAWVHRAFVQGGVGGDHAAGAELHEADGHEKPLLPALSAEPLAEIADGEEEV